MTRGRDGVEQEGKRPRAGPRRQYRQPERVGWEREASQPRREGGEWGRGGEEWAPKRH